MARDPRRRAVPVPPAVEQLLDTALDAALRLQRGAVLGYLNRVRDRRREPVPDELIALLERRYVAAVTAIGAASGGAAAMPGVGTGASVASAALEITAFVEATALFTLAVAEVHGVRTDDPELRRALVLAVLLGRDGTQLAERAAGAGQWAEVLGHRAPEETIRRVNHALAKHFLPRFGARQGALMLGRALPLGIGAGIGAAGNATLARAAIRAARKAFGPAPAKLPPRIIEGSVVAEAGPGGE